jgi:hypothetical protein
LREQRARISKNSDTGDQRVDGGCPPAAFVRTGEGPVAAPYRHGTQLTLGDVVGHADTAVVEEPGERSPALEVCRKDVLELWPERQNDATRPAPAKIGSNAAQRRGKPISDGVRSAINERWPGGIPADLLAKERDEQIIEWLKGKNKKSPRIFRAPSKECLKQNEKLIRGFRPIKPRTIVVLESSDSCGSEKDFS